MRGYFDARVAGFCKELWEYRDRLWTFVEVAGVQPTNNAAEQLLRHAVIWRKLSFGTQSAAGSRFVEPPADGRRDVSPPKTQHLYLAHGSRSSAPQPSTNALLTARGVNHYPRAG